MLKNLIFAMLLAAYYSVIPVYCFMQVFPARTNSKIRNSVQLFSAFIMLWVLYFIKIYGHASEITTLIQLLIFFNMYFLVSVPLKKKILTYFIFLFISILTELLSLNIYMQIYNLFSHHHTYTALNIYALCSFHEKLIIQIIIFTFSYFFYKYVFTLLKECIHYLKFNLLLLITLPLFLPLVVTEFMQYYNFGTHFVPVLLYIVCCCITFLLLMHGFRLLEQEQAAFNRNLHKIDLLKKQMEVSEEMKQECVKIRKWNHDIENHLLSLEYLTRTRKANEAEKYCSSVLLNSSEPDDRTSADTPGSQEESVL